jgi:hypothetical protein
VRRSERCHWAPADSVTRVIGPTAQSR